MSTDLRKEPYNLSEEDICWVRDTICSMSLEEKIGQLFILLNQSTREEDICSMIEKYHIGGIRYTESDAKKIYRQNYLYQQHSRIPVFVAANCEEGGCGASRQGTKVATQAQCGASSNEEAAYELGRIGAKEAEAIGCNWIFGPMADILYNWRNTIVNTRSFGTDAERVLNCCRAYLKGAHESNVIMAVKHFPGDGVEERDQHLVLGVNSLSCEEWDDSFGRVYKTLIEEGLESVMVGHIALPAYSRRLKPGITDEQIKPATMAPELINGLLRTQLGFQGLVVTDASHMGGLLSAASRKEQVPGVIAAGCDMFLFFHDPDEDFQYMLDGYRRGVITEERLQDALEHILGMKAKLKLHKQNMPKEMPQNAYDYLGCESHHQIAAKIADETITLVKDTQNLLPVDVQKKKRGRLYFLESQPISYADGCDPAKQIVIDELEKAGFELDVNESYYELETKAPSAFNRYRVMDKPKVEEFKKRYDVVFVFVNMKGYAQENNVRVKYSAAHSNELPWWTNDVPTICVSLNYTNHLYDLPMMKTFINAYAPTRECIHAVVEKIVGNSPFKGKANEIVWCDSWTTRI